MTSRARCLSIRLPAAAFLAFITLRGDLDAQPPKGEMRSSGNQVNYAMRALQGFDMRVWISNQMVIGQESWDGYVPYPGIAVEYPAGSGVEHVYGGGPWIGGIVDGVRRVSEGYNGDTGGKYLRPDPDHPNRDRIWQTSVRDSVSEPNRRGCDDDGDGRTDEDDLDGMDNDGDWSASMDDVGADGVPDLQETGCSGGFDAVSNPDPAFDNYDRGNLDLCHPLANGSFRRKDDPDLYTEKNGIPDHGEPNVDEDYAAISDQDFYCSATDTNDPPGGHVPMGIKVVQKSYAWADPEYGAIIPFEYSLVNIGTGTIHDVYVAYFMDADVGPVNAPNYPTHNYSCYLDTLRTAFVHNPVDRGSTPIGLAVLGTPKPLNELNFIYQWFDLTTRPSPGTSDSILYSWMSGEPFPDQLIATCESPTNPSDTRFLLSFGPFETLAPGETLKVTLGLVSGDGVDYGRNNLKSNVEKAIALHERMKQPGVPLPRATLPSPPLASRQEDDAIRLDWSGASGPADPRGYWDLTNRFVESFPEDYWRRSAPPCDAFTGCGPAMQCDSAGRLPGGRSFEGYRLYRSTHPGDNPPLGSFNVIREFDLEDGIGRDAGLDTAFVDSNLRVGNRYWYAVTSYTLPDWEIITRPGGGGGAYRDTIHLPPVESGIFENLVRVDLTFRASNAPGEVLVVPNPYRVDHDYTTEGGGWEGAYRDWTDFKRKIRFIHLPRKCTIRIYTVAGDVIATVPYESPSNDPDAGYLDWRLVSESKRPLASGMYVYTVESEFGTQYGKFVVIR